MVKSCWCGWWVAHVILVSPESQLDLDLDMGLLWGLGWGPRGLDLGQGLDNKNDNSFHSNLLLRAAPLGVTSSLINRHPLGLFVSINYHWASAISAHTKKMIPNVFYFFSKAVTFVIWRHIKMSLQSRLMTLVPIILKCVLFIQ